MPTNDKPLSREYKIYLALWRKAELEKDNDPPTPIVLEASSFSVALAIRTGMYKAIKPYRDGGVYEEVLTKAPQSFIVSAIKGPPAQVVISPRASMILLEAELARLGIAEEDLVSPAERAVGEELRQLTKPPSEALRNTISGPNPFYTREG